MITVTPRVVPDGWLARTQEAARRRPVPLEWDGNYGTEHLIEETLPWPAQRAVADPYAVQFSWMWSASRAPPNGRVRQKRLSVASATPSTPGVSDASPLVCGSSEKPPTSTECWGLR